MRLVEVIDKQDEQQDILEKFTHQIVVDIRLENIGLQDVFLRADGDVDVGAAKRSIDFL
mgnify:CR=1 FL=1